MLVGRMDRVFAGALEHFGTLHGAANGAGIERALDASVGMLLAGDNGFGESLMRVAPAIDGADAHLEMLGEFLVGGTEAAHGAGPIGKFWFVDHGAGIAAAAWSLNQAGGVGNVMRVADIFGAVASPRSCHPISVSHPRGAVHYLNYATSP